MNKQTLMNSYFCTAKDALQIAKHIPIIYRWWFPEKSHVMEELQQRLDVNAYGDILSHLKQRTLLVGCQESITLYALYVGKSSDGKTRLKDHLIGLCENSTLRTSVKAIFNNQIEEKEISKYLEEAYIEWEEFPSEQILDCLESVTIAIGCYPLNLNNSLHITQEWVNNLKLLRKQ